MQVRLDASDVVTAVFHLSHTAVAYSGHNKASHKAGDKLAGISHLNQGCLHFASSGMKAAYARLPSG